jgi:DNA-directed RNA polymerase specialized sigma24 family protein
MYRKDEQGQGRWRVDGQWWDEVPDPASLEVEEVLPIGPRLLAALQELTPEELEVIDLSFGLNGLELTRRELAIAMGCTEKHVGVIKRRALDRLHTVLTVAPQEDNVVVLPVRRQGRGSTSGPLPRAA